MARRSSDPWAPPRAVLDADVIFSRVLHELFGRLASELQLLTLIWSDQLLDEAAAALVARKPTTPEVAARWVGYLRDVFPDGRVQLGLLSGSEFAKRSTPGMVVLHRGVNMLSMIGWPRQRRQKGI